MIFCQEIYKSCKSQCIIVRQQMVQTFVTSHLRILASSLRMVAGCCERFTILTDCYESFTDSCEQFTDGCGLLRAVYDTYGLSRVIYGKINRWTIVRRCLTCQNICLSFHESLTVSASCCGL